MHRKRKYRLSNSLSSEIFAVCGKCCFSKNLGGYYKMPSEENSNSNNTDMLAFYQKVVFSLPRETMLTVHTAPTTIGL
jgi:hypothetical protein